MLSVGCDPEEWTHGMQTPRGHLVGTILAVLILAAATASYALSGAIHVQAWVIDTLYTLDITQRIVIGQSPYVDFVLHVGALPYLIMAIFQGSGHAFFLGQLAFAAVSLVIGIWIARTRLDAYSGTLLLVGVVLLASGMSTTFSSKITLGLLYNRWAWALGILFVSATFLDPIRPTRPETNGLLIGLLAFGLFFTKITFFVALVPIAFLRFVVFKKWLETVWASATFLICLVGFAAWYGISFWLGYLEALLWVSGNELRPVASRKLTSVLAGPEFLWSTLLYLAFLLACVRFRGGSGASLWHFALAGGFLFVQYQNYGNVPLWALIAAIFALNFRKQSVEDGTPFERLIWTALAIPFLAFAAYTFWPLAEAHVENMRAKEQGNYVAALSNADALGRVVIAPNLINPATDSETIYKQSTCAYLLGFPSAVGNVAEILAELDEPAFVADATSPHWLVAGAPPLLGAAPWNYGAIDGLENAAFVVVPTCPLLLHFQRKILENIEEAGITLVPYQEREWAQVYRIEMP